MGIGWEYEMMIIKRSIYVGMNTIFILILAQITPLTILYTDQASLPAWLSKPSKHLLKCEACIQAVSKRRRANPFGDMQRQDQI